MSTELTRAEIHNRPQAPTAAAPVPSFSSPLPNSSHSSLSGSRLQSPDSRLLQKPLFRQKYTPQPQPFAKFLAPDFFKDPLFRQNHDAPPPVPANRATPRPNPFLAPDSSLQTPDFFSLQRLPSPDLSSPETRDPEPGTRSFFAPLLFSQIHRTLHISDSEVFNMGILQ